MKCIRNVAVIGWAKRLVEPKLKKAGLKKVGKNPDAVIAVGGDGALLQAEDRFPKVPKFFIYHGSKCKKNTCTHEDMDHHLECIAKGRCSMVEKPKLEAIVNKDKKKRIVCMNDVNVHYRPPRALRYSVYAGGKKLAENVIGDGVLVSTPHGSGAYYKSITGKGFKSGLGIAFNNPVKKIAAKNVKDTARIKVKITRGPGLLAGDCLTKTIPLKAGDVVEIRKIGEKAKMIKLKK